MKTFISARPSPTQAHAARWVSPRCSRTSSAPRHRRTRLVRATTECGEQRPRPWFDRAPFDQEIAGIADVGLVYVDSCRRSLADAPAARASRICRGSRWRGRAGRRAPAVRARIHRTPRRRQTDRRRRPAMRRAPTRSRRRSRGRARVPAPPASTTSRSSRSPRWSRADDAQQCRAAPAGRFVARGDQEVRGDAAVVVHACILPVRVGWANTAGDEMQLAAWKIRATIGVGREGVKQGSRSEPVRSASLSDPSLPRQRRHPSGPVSRPERARPGCSRMVAVWDGSGRAGRAVAGRPRRGRASSTSATATAGPSARMACEAAAVMPGEHPVGPLDPFPMRIASPLARP